MIKPHHLPYSHDHPDCLIEIVLAMSSLFNELAPLLRDLLYITFPVRIALLYWFNNEETYISKLLCACYFTN